MIKSFFNKNSPRDKKIIYKNCEQVMKKKVILPPPPRPPPRPPPPHENNMNFFFYKNETNKDKDDNDEFCGDYYLSTVGMTNCKIN